VWPPAQCEAAAIRASQHLFQTLRPVCHLHSIWRGQSKKCVRPHHRKQSRQSAISHPYSGSDAGHRCL